MFDSAANAAPWVGIGLILMGSWRAGAHVGIRYGASLESAATEAAARRVGKPSPVADDSLPRPWLAAIVVASVGVTFIYANAWPPLDVETVVGVFGGFAIGGALAIGWQAIDIGRSRQAELTRRLGS